MVGESRYLVTQQGWVSSSCPTVIESHEMTYHRSPDRSPPFCEDFDLIGQNLD